MIKDEQQPLEGFLNDLIEKMRPKLLDLTRRNPLLSTPFSEKSHANFRVVDEVPSFLFDKLLADKMRLVSLPSLEEDPKDEESIEFKKAYSSARHSDDVYQEKLFEIDSSDDDYEQKQNTIHRELKDKIRQELGMSERQTKINISLKQHAINHHINPSYELSYELSDNSPQHIDDEIQTLLLPDLFERRLNSILSKVRTWQQETGISVFHVAFGFLEWFDGSADNKSFAPLVLMPAVLEKVRKPTGAEFYVSSEGDSVEHNVVLAEKLRLDYGIDLEVFDNEKSVDEYLVSIEKALPKHLKWRVRKQVALGVFPSAKMAMYHDLNTENWSFIENEAIKTLFTGSEFSSSALYADDYDVDHEEIETKVPFLITEADSSQFSTIVDIVNNKNTAVEGPPGSGKSQTIVNTIAAALNDGKKVLFVAEKSAALQVVKSRLEALNLGEFLLPLLASKGGRSSIINSIKERVEFGGWHLDSLKGTRSAFNRSRNELKKYIDILSMVFYNSELTTHEILGSRLNINEFFSKLPKEIKSYKIDSVLEYSHEGISEIYKCCNDLEDAAEEYLNKLDNWSFINASNLTSFAAEQILEKVEEIEEHYNQNEKLRGELAQYELDKIVNSSLVQHSIDTLEEYSQKLTNESAVVINNIETKNGIRSVKDFYESLEYCLQTKVVLKEMLMDTDDPENITRLDELINIYEKYSVDIVSSEQIDSIKDKYKEALESYVYLDNVISAIIKLDDSFNRNSTDKLIKMLQIASEVENDVLDFRHKLLEDKKARKRILSRKKLAESIRGMRISLNEIFSLDRNIDINELQDHTDTLVDPGFFSLFNSKYRAAKKYYKVISRNHQFKYKTALDNTETLLGFLKKEKEITEDKLLNELFQYNNEGVNSDFNLAEKAISFYNIIDENFGLEDDDKIREFFFNEKNNAIKDLPSPDIEKIRITTNQDNHSKLSEKLTQLRSAQQTLSQDILNIKEIFVHLSKKEIHRNELVSTRNLLQQYLTQYQKIDHANAKNLLGNHYLHLNTDINNLKNIIDFCDKLSLLPECKEQIICACIENKNNELQILLSDLLKSENKYGEGLSVLASLLRCKTTDIINASPENNIIAWVKRAKSDRDGLLNYSKLLAYKNTVYELGFENIVKMYADESKNYNRLKDVVRAVYLNNLSELIYEEFGDDLAKFNGLKLNSLRNELAEKDKELQKWSSFHIAEKLTQNANPPGGIGRGPKRDWTELSLINNEIAKKKQHISPRALTRRAGRALLELKPCWMMSPLSVAQYISKGGIEFDLLIIDEGSQMTPENAIGALARCKQAMIVGDTNQLPPSSFFKKFIVDDEEDEDSVSEESILEIANNAFRPARRLRWHYRSRHSSLIAFSNKYIYDNDLTIYPSASEDHPSLGVSMVETEGIYSSGSNPIEASVTIEHIIKFMREQKCRSLGVVTINKKQCDLLNEEFEYAIAKNPELNEYINYWDEENDGLEEFFIKNLENVQGDERDVIFISTVYGPASPGAKVMQRFGPINGVAGKRRLNVLFTRAKEQIITFSSMTSVDILANEDSNPGVFLLKQWFDYSKTGVLEAGVITHKEPDSEFEEYVIEQIKSMGCEATPQVGVSGYFIDIGVRHPLWSHGFILGVECDGASYHSSKSARDRDRLREEVLVNLGWKIYRIWSTDWFENPRAEAEKLRIAIQERIDYLLKEKAPDYIDKNKKSTEQVLETIGKNISVTSTEDTPRRIDEGPDDAFYTPPQFVTHLDADAFKDLESTNDLENKPSQTKNDSETLTDEQARSLLVKLRDEEIAEEFEFYENEKGILNDRMIDAFLAVKPETLDDFHKKIPSVLRDKIDRRQMIYLKSILNICSSSNII